MEEVGDVGAEEEEEEGVAVSNNLDLSLYILTTPIRRRGKLIAKFQYHLTADTMFVNFFTLCLFK